MQTIKPCFLSFQTKEAVFKIALPKNVTGEVRMPRFYRLISLFVKMPLLL